VAKIRIVLKPREKIKQVVVTLMLEVTDHVEGGTYFISKMVAAAEWVEGALEVRKSLDSIKREICTSILGVRVPHIQIGMVRVPRILIGIQIGDNLAHK
jgi:hypothetical protein